MYCIPHIYTYVPSFIYNIPHMLYTIYYRPYYDTYVYVVAWPLWNGRPRKERKKATLRAPARAGLGLGTTFVPLIPSKISESRRFPLKDSFKEDVDTSIDVDMDSDLAVSTTWGFL